MTPDTLLLYRWSVQDPDTQAAVMSLMYGRVRGGREPVLLREDFAGTAAEAVAWVALNPTRRAIAIDTDGAALKWARQRAERILGGAADRITFIEGDVLKVGPPQAPPADIIVALNFSLFYLRDRAALAAYLRHARQSLAEGGVLVFNAFGGPGAMRTGIIDRRVVEPKQQRSGDDAPPPFEYQWEQRTYDAVSGAIDCRIHFAVPDGKGGQQNIRDAFVYDWRLWTLPELTELTRHAGFSDVQVWRHTYDAAKGREGVFLGAVDAIANVETWVAYVVASR